MTVETRQLFPDRLRGIALLGIVVVNAPFFGISAGGYTAASLEGPLNSAAAFLVFALAQNKFYLLFSFLFGYSSQFILRTNDKKDRRRFRRRLMALWVLGVIHATLFFVGDILITYSIFGAGLLVLNGRSARTVKISAIVAGCVSVLLAVSFAAISSSTPMAVANDPTIVALDAAIQSGSFVDVALARINALPSVWTFTFLLQGTMAFGAFCLGLLAARRKLLADPAQVAWGRWAVIGLAVGLPLQIISAIIGLGGIAAADPVAASIGIQLGYATAPILSLGYLAGMGWLLSRRPGFLAFAQVPGRVSLSTYLSESVLLSLLFCAYGLGRFGHWGAAGVLAASVAAYLLFEVGAKLWLDRFSQGPIETLVAKWTGPRQSPALTNVPST